MDHKETDDLFISRYVQDSGPCSGKFKEFLGW